MKQIRNKLELVALLPNRVQASGQARRREQIKEKMQKLTQMQKNVKTKLKSKFAK
jgi:hypothetical protein